LFPSFFGPVLLSGAAAAKLKRQRKTTLLRATAHRNSFSVYEKPQQISRLPRRRAENIPQDYGAETTHVRFDSGSIVSMRIFSHALSLSSPDLFRGPIFQCDGFLERVAPFPFHVIPGLVPGTHFST
jgi:hypothetical protein